MLKFRYIIILACIVLHLSKAERRILRGQTLNQERRYVVYMIKANPSVLYDAWMCGGAIVSPWYIVTSAACVEDVKHMYAIAGYVKYVTYDTINADTCTANYKKKIVYVCLPSEYNFDYPRVERWANIDIALVKVESKYDFKDTRYKQMCSYIPGAIEINYDRKLQEPGTSAIVFGWGHTEKWRSVEDTRDYNQKALLYGSVKIAQKEECKKYFDEPKVKNIIDKYMICSMEEGAIDDAGDVIEKAGKDDPEKYKTDCGPGALRMGDECIADPDYTRRGNANAPNGTRRSGICQNDHGGPLITWRGPKEVLIGIASVFRVQGSTKTCIPPFLYTSTHCNGAFLHCLMDSNDQSKEKLKLENAYDKCDALAKQGGFEIIRRSISWASHPDGPAENEKTVLRKTKELVNDTNIRIRPQIRFKNLGLN